MVVGGGVTASDCVGTAFRQGAVKVTQLDIRPRPPQTEDKLAVWPFWATKGAPRRRRLKALFASFRGTLEFVGEDGVLTGVKCCQVDERRKPIAGTEFIIKADLAFIAIGFSGPFTDSVLKELNGKLELNTDRRGSTNVVANDKDYRSSVDKLWVAGDARRGQSLVVWAIREDARPPAHRRGADGGKRAAALRGASSTMSSRVACGRPFCFERSAVAVRRDRSLHIIHAACRRVGGVRTVSDEHVAGRLGARGRKWAPPSSSSGHRAPDRRGRWVGC